MLYNENDEDFMTVDKKSVPEFARVLYFISLTKQIKSMFQSKMAYISRVFKVVSYSRMRALPGLYNGGTDLSFQSLAYK